jgi:hypothetical protein
MAKPTTTGKFAQKGTRGISSLIFLASFILSAFLALGTLTTNRALGLRASIPGGQGLLQFYVSGQGLLTLVPLDLILLIYTFFIILDIVTLRVLAEAQIAAEENPEHAQRLAGKAEKYIDWALSGLVFFITVEFSSALSSLHILIEGDNFWVLSAISVIVAMIARSIMHRLTDV